MQTGGNTKSGKFRQREIAEVQRSSAPEFQDSATRGGTPREEDFDARTSKRPEYAFVSIRLESFSGWQGKLDAHELAEAGMYWKGEGDRTACFHCEIPLKEWERHDAPWIEHARFSPTCKYLIFIKEFPYIASVLEFYEIHHAEFKAMRDQNRAVNINRVAIQESFPSASAVSSKPTPSAQPPRPRRVIRRVEPREIRSRLDSDRCKMVLDQGYPRELVGQVIGEQLQTEADDFETFADFLRAVMNAADMLGIQPQPKV